MATWFNGNQFQAAFEGANYHHLASDIVERHTEQGSVAWAQTKEIASNTGRSEHTTLLD